MEMTFKKMINDIDTYCKGKYVTMLKILDEITNDSSVKALIGEFTDESEFKNKLMEEIKAQELIPPPEKNHIFFSCNAKEFCEMCYEFCTQNHIDYAELKGIPMLSLVTHIQPNEAVDFINSFINLEEFEKLLESHPDNISKKSNIPFDFIEDMLDSSDDKKIIGRTHETDRLIELINRKTKANVILVGEAGVGKTTVMWGLCQKIKSGQMPNNLMNSKVYSLSLGTFMSSTKYRGELESKFSNMMKWLTSHKENVILFIDEIHTLMGCGASSGSPLDISNLLKPFTSGDSKLRIVGATTLSEYRNHIEKDKAFARRFQTVQINEPSIQECIEICNGLKKSFEDYHKVHFSKGSIETAIKLSSQYITDRYLPDKAIDVLDETASRININNKSQGKHISPSDIQDTISKIAKIPSENMSTNEIEKLKSLSESLESNVFGQDEAIKLTTRSIYISKAGLTEKEKPIANFLFVGPTGVGKTEMAKTIADTMSIPLIRFDMSEYKDKTSVNKLIGSSAGYVGYEEGGQLVKAIRKTPSCVLLLDEIEKAHPDVFDLLLQVMDAAKLTDNHGEVADFKNVILIMTSNCGASDLTKSQIGFNRSVINTSAIDSAVESSFAPEFRNRLTAIVKFNSLSKTMAIKIAQKQLKKLAEKLGEKKIKISYKPEILDAIAQKSQTSTAIAYGGREIIRIVDNEIKTQFVDEILFGNLRDGGRAQIIMTDDGKFGIEIIESKKSKSLKKTKEPVIA